MTEDDVSNLEAMGLAALDVCPEDFDRLVNANQTWQITLLRWRGDLTLASRAYYRQITRAYSAAFEDV
jgi:hypothetical protein